jgi:cyclophilin family peptidyl-prolyl cis-trans isomerase
MNTTKSVLLVFIFILLTYCKVMGQTPTIVVLNTTEGDIRIKLYNETPLHRDNFIKLVKEEYYDGVLFHRVIQNFMIQTGDPNSKNANAGQSLGDGGPGYTIPAEFVPSLFHKKGALAAARQGDQVNPRKESSGSQFYIVQGQVLNVDQLDALVRANKHIPFTEEEKAAYTTIGGTPHLDQNYTVFGEVIEGLDVLDKIASVETDQRNRPLSDIRIIKVYFVQ